MQNAEPLLPKIIHCLSWVMICIVCSLTETLSKISKMFNFLTEYDIYIHPGDLVWTEAAALCQEKGMTLTKVDTQFKLDKLLLLLPQASV